MKIIALSDSHGGAFYIKKALDMHRDADAAIFLGDGVRDFYSLRESYPAIAFLGVRGNCDIGYGDVYGAQITEEITLGGKRIFACHGHTYSVKGGLGVLADAARARGADIALFGHTHKRCELYFSPEGDDEHPLYLINPGSIGGRGDGAHSFAVIEIKENGTLVSFGCV